LKPHPLFDRWAKSKVEAAEFIVEDGLAVDFAAVNSPLVILLNYRRV
jgi:hypothetical protein